MCVYMQVWIVSFTLLFVQWLVFYLFIAIPDRPCMHSNIHPSASPTNNPSYYPSNYSSISPYIHPFSDQDTQNFAASFTQFLICHCVTFIIYHSSWNFAIARNPRNPRNLVLSAHSANPAHSAKSRAIPAQSSDLSQILWLILVIGG